MYDFRKSEAKPDKNKVSCKESMCNNKKIKTSNKANRQKSKFPFDVKGLEIKQAAEKNRKLCFENNIKSEILPEEITF